METKEWCKKTTSELSNFHILFSVYSLENLSHDDAQNSAGHGEDTELGRHKEFTVSSQRETGL